MKITNNTRDTMDFVVKGEAKDGVLPTESVEPGETKTINVADPEASYFKGRVLSGSVTVERASASASKAKE